MIIFQVLFPIICVNIVGMALPNCFHCSLTLPFNLNELSKPCKFKQSFIVNCAFISYYIKKTLGTCDNKGKYKDIKIYRTFKNIIKPNSYSITISFENYYYEK